MSTEKDMKFDSDKCRLDLIDPAFTEGVGNVLTFGAKKYEAESWKTVKNGLRRYLAAAERHILAIKKGEINDSESGLPHAYHAATDLMMAQWFVDQQVDKPDCPFRVLNTGVKKGHGYRCSLYFCAPCRHPELNVKACPTAIWKYNDLKGDREANMAMFAPTTAPECFGSNPGPQQRAENDCGTCSDRRECDEVSQEAIPGGITEVSKPGPLTQTLIQSVSSGLKPTATCPLDGNKCHRPAVVCRGCPRYELLIRTARG